ncbi:MAG: hypothetical protein ACH37Z_07385 [Anaerolineae bacterium]|jgi:predicted lysophospholipase L1 biosynthesis ABC-type transport system permease subunit|nr:hypothetical protein [Ardenticatenia bacterium]MBK8539390.1 hypothetical protein [Ardenticatenia bacterium]HQZ71881.1 hypothetical protein [Anaerolineae bacterium]HRA21162.1 hypothetical protein [Anaerolineae bacterium]
MKAYLNSHPHISSWALLSLAFLAALGWSARDVVDLAARQWLVLAAAAVATAGLCAWILSWEADEDDPLVDADAAPGKD